ncbi:MAG: DUF4139 domain-containing protein [Hyphomicrobiales bacterium]|nr:DUF4139 domain-containing protein [Hyphomicrobiales bacterium]
MPSSPIRRALLAAAALVLLPAAGAGAETVSTAAQRSGLGLTVYNQGFSVVRDARVVDLPKGESRIAFEDVARQIVPETVILQGDPPVVVLEQAMQREALTAAALLRRAVGGEVTLVQRNPATGAETRRRARVLSADGGGVFLVDGHLEAGGGAGRVVFDGLPTGLRARAALETLVNAAGPGKMVLSYVTQGLSWRADYVGHLNGGENKLRITAWATLNNGSGARYVDAGLTLVAGTVNRAPTPRPEARYKAAAPMAMGGAAADMATAPEGDLHVFHAPRPVTIEDGQTKQIALFGPVELSAAKEYVARVGSNFFGRQPEPQEFKPRAVLVSRNETGFPVPAGTVRVYRTTGTGQPLLAGEDQVGHVAKEAPIRLDLGNAFDLRVKRTQTDFQRFTQSRNLFESAYSFELANASDKDVVIRVEEYIHGDWTMVEESLPHTKETAALAVWQVPVAAGGTAALTYRVRVRN